MKRFGRFTTVSNKKTCKNLRYSREVSVKPGKHALVILVTLIVLVACLLVPAITSQRALAATGWSSVGGKQPNCNLSYDTANGCIYSGYVGGVEKYDGTNWTDLGAPSGITNPEALCVCAMGDTVYAGFDDYFSSANEGIWYYYNGTWSNTDQGSRFPSQLHVL